MRETLSFILKEKGYMLPPVLLLCTFVLLSLSTNIISLQHDVKMTYNIIEQVKSQTLFEMGYIMYKEDELENSNNGTVEYHFPNGKVLIESNILEDLNYVKFNIETDRQYYATVTKMLKISPEKEKTPIYNQ